MATVSPHSGLSSRRRGDAKCDVQKARPLRPGFFFARLPSKMPRMSQEIDNAVVRVRVATLDDAPGSEGCLDAGERERLSALRDPVRRRQYLAGHALARELATALAGGEPAAWCWQVCEDGRRELRRGALRLCVSPSHSGRHVAVAVAARPVGLDLEARGDSRDWATLARQLFSPPLAAWVLSSPEGVPARFRRAWALVEARAKRSGEGIQRRRVRTWSFEPAAMAAADAWTWPLDDAGHCLAVAAWPGARVLGLPEAVAEPWRGMTLA